MTPPLYEPGAAEAPRPPSPSYQLPLFNQPPQYPQHGYPAAPWPGGYGGVPPYGPPPRRGNGMAVAGFVLSFLVGLLGLGFSIAGLRRSREPGRGGAGLATAGIVISLANLALGALLVLGGGSLWPTYPTAQPSPPAAVPAVGSTTVAGACSVIVPALTGAQGGLQSAGTEAEAVRQVDALADTLEQQGAAAGDPGFARDTAALAQLFRSAMAQARVGHPPDLSAVQQAAEQVGYDCGRAGVPG